MPELNQQDIIEDLKRAQGKHLRAVENWAKQQPKVAGIAILPSLTYDIIQVVNQVYLTDLLKQAGAK